MKNIINNVGAALGVLTGAVLVCGAVALVVVVAALVSGYAL